MPVYLIRNPGNFQLGLVQAKVVYTNSKSEAVVDLTFGPNANLGNYGNFPFQYCTCY